LVGKRFRSEIHQNTTNESMNRDEGSYQLKSCIRPLS